MALSLDAYCKSIGKLIVIHKLRTRTQGALERDDLRPDLLSQLGEITSGFSVRVVSVATISTAEAGWALLVLSGDLSNAVASMR